MVVDTVKDLGIRCHVKERIIGAEINRTGSQSVVRSHDQSAESAVVVFVSNLRSAGISIGLVEVNRSAVVAHNELGGTGNDAVDVNAAAPTCHQTRICAEINVCINIGDVV